jgi:enamine deaminase RidA (YjgF/YER057c/UK114 family)
VNTSGGTLTPWRVRFRDPADAGGEDFVVPVPPLGARDVEEMFGRATPAGVRDGIELFRAGDLLLGRLRERFAPAGLAAATETAYSRLFDACAGRSLYRIWNYVPRINETCDGLENYRAFCVGRAQAFETRFGEGYAKYVPAASALGCGGDELTVLFVAGEAAPRHLENPVQLPAYEYPAEHGPRPPSFARATVVEAAGGGWAFVSGTAAVRGHATLAVGDFAAQLECTLENLRLISRAAGLGEALRPAGIWRRHFKVYLRHAADYARARTRFEEALATADDHVIYLRSDICRAALEIEIEATLERVT